MVLVKVFFVCLAGHKILAAIFFSLLRVASIRFSGIWFIKVQIIMGEGMILIVFIMGHGMFH